MFEGFINDFTGTLASFKTKLIIADAEEMTDTNTGHIVINFTREGYSSDSGSIEMDITSPNDNMPALALSLNEGLPVPTLTSVGCRGGFRVPTGLNYTFSNIENIGWDTSSIAGFSPINSVVASTLWSRSNFRLDRANNEATFTITVSANFPLFMSSDCYDIDEVEGLGTYYQTNAGTKDITNVSKIAGGDYSVLSEAINYHESIDNTIPENEVYTIRTHLKKNGSVVAGSSKAYDFKIPPDTKMWIVYTEKSFGDDTANFILHTNADSWLQKNAYAPDSAYQSTSVLDTDYWRGTWQDYDNGDSYVGWSSTNIPIFTSEEKGAAYGRGEIGIDEALNGGATTFYISTIGNTLSASDIPTVNLSTSGVGCYIYALSEADLKEIMGTYLYTDDATLKAAYVDALWMWGNNPIDFMIDLYYIPFAISNFYDTNNAALKFGTYQIPDTSYDVVIEANGDRITLFETSFEGIYNDWRDFTQFDYDLFLPFVGWFKLDPQKYVNKMVRCEMMFDITTHNLRYYLFADDVIIDRVDGSVGINLPLMATDQVNKAKQDRDRKYGVLSSAIGAGTSIGMGLTSKDMGGALTGVINGISQTINGIKQYNDMKQHASESVEGAFSSSMNIYDITYAYLRITERPLLMPDKLHTLYGYPCYYMGKASALSGYCEISDIRLSGFTGTKDEAEALKITLREGVIL